MANVVLPNLASLSPTVNDLFFAIWKLTRAMKKAGWTYKSSGNGTIKDTSGLAGNDLWGTNADPTTDTYPSWSTTTTWWNAQGPSTLKIPISSAQVPGTVGSFMRGENITQATTQAKGELLGYLFDPAPSGGGGPAGYLVVAPRVDGYGADPHGWDHTHAITGDISGASITPSATVIEFVREVVIWKTNNLLQGTIYYQCVDGYSENTSRYSYLASNAAGCNATTAPGGGGSGNGFPTPGSFVVEGTGGANTPAFWMQAYNTSPTVGRSLAIVANATYGAGVSADGSFACASGIFTGGGSGSFLALMFTRVDEQEDGDVDPYVWYAPSATAIYTVSRTADVSVFSSNVSYWDVASVGVGENFFKFWRRRGWGGTSDAFQGGAFSILYVINASAAVIGQGFWDREKLANTYNDTYMLEDVWCVSVQQFQRTRKGRCRWLKIVCGGNACDTYNNKTWLQMCHASTANGYAIVIGPWDGTSVQTQG